MNYTNTHGMISEKYVKGIVSDTSRGKIWVVLSNDCTEKQQSCLTGGCSACSGRNMRRRIRIETDDRNIYTAGTEVLVHTFEINEALCAFIAFGIPLLTSFSVLIIWYAVDRCSVESGKALASTVLAFFGGFVVVRLIDRILRKRFPSTIIESKPCSDFSQQGVDNG